MIKILCLFLASITTAPALAVESMCCDKEVAIINYSRLNEGKLEGTVKDVQLKPMIGRNGYNTVIRLLNEQFEPRQIIVRILELTEPEYDLYVDEKFLGVYKKENLESGISISLSGTMVSPVARDFFKKLRERGREGADRYAVVMGEDGSLARALMKGVVRWSDDIERGDDHIRTASIILAQPGSTLNLPGKGIPKPPDYAASLKRFGDAVQLARMDAVRKIRDPKCRLDTLMVLTPLDFNLLAPDGFVPGKKSVVRAVFTNWTDRTIKTCIKLNVPSDWKVTALSKDTTVPGFARKCEFKFEVIVPKYVKPGPPVSADVSLKVDGIAMQLSARAQKN